MKRRRLVFVVGALAALTTAHLNAGQPESTESASPPAVDEDAAYSLAESFEDFVDSGSASASGEYNSYWEDCPECDACFAPVLAARFGWWGVSTDGSRNKIGEYQDLKSGPFWDVDGITSDGERTFDFNATGTDNETNSIGLNYYQPEFSTDIQLDRFLHRLDHDEFQGFDRTEAEAAATPWYIGPAVDFNAGEDYAIRVETLGANFKGDLSENVKWRVNVWQMRKFGERQARALNHNCSDQQCHIQAQRQTIDWRTIEVEPVIEAKLTENATIEYSRTMRSFEQSDGLVTRDYPSRPTLFADETAQQPYAVVPENFTQIDRLKFRWQLGDDTHLYAMGYVGDTENKNRDTHRRIGGYDVRLTNTSVDGVTLTGYTKYYESNNQKPPSNPELGIFQPGTFNPDPITGHDPNRSDDPRHPVDRRKTTAGLKGRWRPFQQDYRWNRMSLGGGYEYHTIDRDHVLYDIAADGSSFFGPTETFMQPTTVSNSFFVDTRVDWSDTVNSFARYTWRHTRNPLFGVRENTESNVEEHPDADIAAIEFAVNSNLPTQEDLVEFGGTWTPTDYLLLNATFGLLMRDHRSDYAHFSEDDYPITFSAAYAATEAWSIHGGVAFLSNWIRQESTIGIDHASSRGTDLAENIQMNYGGRAHVINIGTTYAWTERLILSGLLEYVGGMNGIQDPSIPGQDLSLIPGASDVDVRTTRVNAGVDYVLRDGVDCFFRYNYYDWSDRAGNSGSGTAHMFLTGVSAVR